MKKQIFIYMFVIIVIWSGVYFFQNKYFSEISVQKSHQENKIQEHIIHKDLSSNISVSEKSDSSPLVVDEIIAEVRDEPRSEKIIYPREYSFKNVDAGPIYEKAGTKIKVDFSYMLDKNIGDEVTIHFPTESVTGKIIKYETDNGPSRIVSYSIHVEVNDSLQPDGRILERIYLSLYEQDGAIIKASGSYDISTSDGMFVSRNGLGYFATKQEYADVAKDYVMD